MRFIAVLIIFFSLSITLSAQKNGYGLSIKALFLDYQSTESTEFEGLSGLDNGLELGFHAPLSPQWELVVPAKIGLVNFTENGNNVFVGHLDAQLQYHFYQAMRRANPYIMSGLGIATEEFDNSNIQIPLALGVNVRLKKGTHINVQGSYRFSFEEDRDNVQLGLGIIQYFGKYPDDIDTSLVETIFPDTTDSDLDGIINILDNCPRIPGLADFGGCPDTDEDGIQDSLDKCPLDAGAEEFKGCPDTDGDGIEDLYDECPNIAGTTLKKGCPEIATGDIGDRDNDGVKDDLDQCPNESGLAKFNGCPDSDGDGVQDLHDDCPLEYGSEVNNGCPNASALVNDRDGDHILDDIDRCPDRYGLLRHSGCPDTDNDDVSDIDDRCPAESGSKALGGCPDSDGDGIENGRDRCPFEAGLATNQGCPEIKQEVREILDFAMRAVQFEHSRASLKTESLGVLDQIVEIMNQYPQYSLSVEGHTDDTGEATFNQKLSDSRAERCYEYIVGKGISASRMTHAGFGETKPISNNETYKGRSLNRRVEFNLFIR